MLKSRGNYFTRFCILYFYTRNYFSRKPSYETMVSLVPVRYNRSILQHILWIGPSERDRLLENVVIDGIRCRRLLGLTTTTKGTWVVLHTPMAQILHGTDSFEKCIPIHFIYKYFPVDTKGKPVHHRMCFRPKNKQSGECFMKTSKTGVLTAWVPGACKAMAWGLRGVAPPLEKITNTGTKSDKTNTICGQFQFRWFLKTQT